MLETDEESIICANKTIVQMGSVSITFNLPTRKLKISEHIFENELD